MIVEKIVSVTGAASAVSTLACCLPVSGSALFGLGSVLGVAAQYQAWLLPLAGVMLATGGGLIWRSRKICHRTSKASLAILALSVAVVLLVFLFPQTVINILTDWMS
jgi:hypothetical protein